MQILIYGFFIAAFVGGIAFGTQMPWYYEVIAVMAGILFTEYGPFKELAAIFPLYATVLFAIGCIIGDISWAIQTDTLPGVGELINSIGNPFKVDN